MPQGLMPAMTTAFAPGINPRPTLKLNHPFFQPAASHDPFTAIDHVYRTLPAEFSNKTLESTAVSGVAGKCEQKPTPT